MEEKKTKTKWLIGASVVLLALGYGINTYIAGRGYESTDNAQLDGDLLPVRAGITGYIADIRFRDNQEIKKGDTLIIFETTEIQADTSRIAAELENARLNVAVSKGMAAVSLENAHAAIYESQSTTQNIASAKATYDKAVTDYTRAQQLLAIKAITQTDYEHFATQVDVTKAAYLKAKALEQSAASNSSGLKTRALTEEKQVSLAENVILQKQAALDAARERLRHAYVIAPFDGIVTKRNVQTGQFINAGQALCAVINHKNCWVTANFKETQLNRIKTGQQVNISVDAYEDVHLTGVIDSYGGATGARFALVPPDNATGNFIKIAQRFPVRIKLDPQTVKAPLYPGLSVFVKVKVN